MNILTITTPDIENGEGFRVTVWCAGCSHHCPGCHNPHTWSYAQGSPLMSPSVLHSIFTEVSKPYIQGITLSGGDPLCQTDDSLRELQDFIEYFREQFPDKDIWLYTGYTLEEIECSELRSRIIHNCDTIVEGRYIEHLRDGDLAFRGSSNQHIIHMKDGCIHSVE